MGKKMGINTKAVEARERRESQKQAKNAAIEKKRDDEFWRDDDKHVNRKLDRQKEREIKAQEGKDRKAANRAAYEQDMELAEKSAKAKASKLAVEVPKVTRHDIEKNIEQDQRQLSKQIKKVNLAPTPLVPNLNRLDDGENASSIDQALDLLKSHTLSDSSSSKGNSRRH